MILIFQNLTLTLCKETLFALTLDLQVRYSLSAYSLLFKIVAPNFMSTGAELQWLSAFPSEAEMLFPPLTYLQATGRTGLVHVERDGQELTFAVVEVTPSLA